MQETPQEIERKETFGLLLRLNVVAYCLPLAALLGILAYVYFFEIELGRKDWSRIVFILWIGAMFGIGWAVFRSLRGSQRVQTGSGLVRVQRKTVADWEAASTGRIVRDFLGYLVIVPSLAMALIWGANRLYPIVLLEADWKVIIMTVWLCSLASLILPVRRALKAKMGR